MKVKQLIELFRNTDIYVLINQYKCCPRFSDLYVDIYIDKKYKNRIYVSELNKGDDSINNYLEMNIKKVSSFFNAGAGICLEVNEEITKETKPILEDLFDIFKDSPSYVFYGSNPFEVLIKTKDGYRKWVHKGFNLNRYGDILPWGIEKLKEMEILEIIEINSQKEIPLRILVKEN